MTENPQAIENLSRALELEPENAAVYNTLGMLFQKRGEPGHAADCYRQALAIAPGHADVAANLAALPSPAER